jgi:hypothetical protein
MTKEINAYMIVRCSKEGVKKLENDTVYNEEDVDKKIEELALTEPFDFMKVEIHYMTSVKPVIEKNSFKLQERIIEAKSKKDEKDINTFNNPDIRV